MHGASDSLYNFHGSGVLYRGLPANFFLLHPACCNEDQPKHECVVIDLMHEKEIIEHPYSSGFQESFPKQEENIQDESFVPVEKRIAKLTEAVSKHTSSQSLIEQQIQLEERCTFCQTTNTTEWHLESKTRTLCNNCWLRYKPSTQEGSSSATQSRLSERPRSNFQDVFTAEEISKVDTFAKKAVRKNRVEYGNRRKNPYSNFHICRECGTTESPRWRKGSYGPRTLCDPCGTRYVKSLKEMRKGKDQLSTKPDGTPRIISIAEANNNTLQSSHGKRINN
jgi:hypothetical protein